MFAERARSVKFMAFSWHGLCEINSEDAKEMKGHDRAGEHLTPEEEKLSPEGLVPVCAWCGRIRDDSGYWTDIENYAGDYSAIVFTHGICPGCLKEHSADTFARIEEDGGSESS